MSDPEEYDFQDPVNVPANVYARKRQRSDNNDQRYSENEQDLIEASLCTLCQRHWTNHGKHVIVNLKCGHLFGKSCIEQHIRNQISKLSFARCPVCDQTVNKADPRLIWAEKLIPCDEEDLKALTLEHKKADQTSRELDEAIMELRQQINIIKDELDKVQSEATLMELLSKPSLPKADSRLSMKDERLTGQFVYQRTFSLPNESYRVMDLNAAEDMAVLSVSKKSDQLFGIRKLNFYDNSLTEFIPTHSGQIKDLKQASNNMILSTGLDKSLKLTSLSTNTVVQSYDLDVPGWSCATDHNSPNVMYCGLTNNAVLVFDIRNTKGSVCRLNEPCSPRVYSPIHSMNVFNINSTNVIACSNFEHSYSWSTDETDKSYNYKYDLLEQLVGCAYEKSDNYKSFSMAYNHQTLFTSLRTKLSTRYEVAHFELSKVKVGWYYDDVGHKQSSLSRNTHFERNGETYICFSDNDMVKIRNKYREVQKIKVKGAIVDIKHTKQDNHTEILAVLAENELQTFKFS